MISDNKKYIAELDIKSIGRGLATGALIGTGLFGGMVTGAKVAGIGRFAPHTQPEQIQTKVIPSQTNTVTQTQQSTQTEEKPKINQQTVKKETAEVEQHQFVNEHIKRLYGAFVHAEHRGHVTDPHKYNPKLKIRTREGGGISSSYGDLQLNTTVSGFLDKSDPYESQLMAQLKKMNKANKNHPVYGLGRPGDLSGPEHHASYQKAGEKVLLGKIREALGKNFNINNQMSKAELNRIIKHFNKGLGSKEEPAKWYVDTIHKHYYGN